MDDKRNIAPGRPLGIGKGESMLTSKRFQVRLYPEDFERMSALSGIHKTCKSNIVRESITQMYEKDIKKGKL